MRSDIFLSLGPHGFHRVAYAEWGDPANRHIVVCMHGLTRNSRDFDYLANSLAGQCRVVSMDVAGRGESDWLEFKEDYGFALYQSDAAALLARVTAPPPRHRLFDWLRRLFTGREQYQIDWVGTSMGGVVGMMLAARRNSPIRRLVLNDVGPLVPWSGLARLKGYAGQEQRYASLDEAEAHLRDICASFGPLTDEQWQHMTRHSVRQLDDGTFELNYDPGIVASLHTPVFPDMSVATSLQGIELWEIWDAVKCPTLVLRGAESDFLLADTANEMGRRGPRAKIVEFAGIGHAPALMDKEQIQAVREFLLAPESAIARNASTLV